MTPFARSLWTGLVFFAVAVRAPAAMPGDPVQFRYLEVPLSGEVGKEITAPGVRAAIAQAKTRKATHVVFVIDTLGGLAEDGRAIARVMGEPRGEMRYFVVVKRAISAGVWPMSQADRVFFARSGAAGAAVAFSPTADKAEQVNAKFNSAIAALLAANAASHGQNGLVYRAMVVMDAALYEVKKPGGAIELVDQPPAAGDFKELDTPRSIFTLTPQLAEEIGFARILPGDDAKSIAQVEHIEWESLGVAADAMRSGARTVEERVKDFKRAADQLNAARDRVGDLAKQIAAQVERARAASPANLTVTYNKGTGTLSGESQNRWREQTDVAIAHWDDVLRLCSQLEGVKREMPHTEAAFQQAYAREWAARLYEGKPDPIRVPTLEDALDLAEIRKQAGIAQSDLRAGRIRSKF